jgi:protein involved in polysaccharide export with SLBB domain
LKYLGFLVGFALVAVGAISTIAQTQPSDTIHRDAGVSFDEPINPDIYLIRPGERLTITAIKAGLPSSELVVNPEGKIIDARIGVVDVAGRTLTQVRALLAEPLARQFRAAEINVSVTAPRLVSIQVTGAVAAPGTYTVYTSQRVSEVIRRAGGLTAEASLRHISLFGGPKPVEVDLDRAIYAHDHGADPAVYGGTTVTVPPRSLQIVRVVGEVLKPRDIELIGSESTESLIALASGALPTGDPSLAYVSGDSTRSLNGTGAVKAGDILVVPVRSDLLRQSGLIVTGAVRRSGGFGYEAGMTLDRLLALAGGPTERANDSRTVVFRRQERMEPGSDTLPRIPISNLRGLDGKARSLTLRPFDSVYVPVMIGIVRVSGYVRHPGVLPYESGKPANFYILAAGGYVAASDRAEVLIRNRITGEMLPCSPDALVQDGDEVVVPSMESGQ